MPNLVPNQHYQTGENITKDILNRPISILDQNVDTINDFVENLLDDSVIVTDKGWSSSKIYSELNAVQGFVGMVKMPDPIAPLSGSTGVAQGVTLSADGYEHVYSGVARTVRRFQIDLINGDFSTPLYEHAENVDSHSITYTLSTDTSYKWRCRDEADDGNNSAWMLPQSFTTASVFVDTPTLENELGGSLSSSENENEDFIIVIGNYDASHTYTVSVTGGTFSLNSDTITWSLPEVASDTQYSITVYATDINGDNSDTATHTLNVLNVPIEGDDAIQVTDYSPVQNTNDGFTHA